MQRGKRALEWGSCAEPQRWVGTVTGVPGHQMAFLEEGS